MQEVFKMRNGKMVDFYARLTPAGIIVEVQTFMREAEKPIFKKEIMSERDVVKIIYLAK